MTELTGEAAVTDLIGQRVEVGDAIAAAFRVGNVADLRIGTVLGFGERGNKLTIKVRWTLSSFWGGAVDKTGSIEADLGRFLKVERLYA